MVEFHERTIRILIDDTLCPTCETHACVEACTTYARGILTLQDNLPTVTTTPEELKRLGTECLACEEACRLHGKAALRIEIPIPGLPQYRETQPTIL
jgi:hypothetical protein